MSFLIGTTKVIFIDCSSIEINTYAQFLPEAIIKEAQTRFQSNKRIKEWLGARLIVAKEFGTNATIEYEATGKPLLNHTPGYHISITHTSGIVAVAYDTIPIGIDLETVTPRTLKVVEKFLQPAELQIVNTSHMPSLLATQLWCCKEAIYKLVNIPNLSLKNDILLTQLQDNLFADEYHKVTVTLLQNKDLILALSTYM